MADLETKSVEVTLSDGETHRIPYWELTTGRPGPRILVTAAFHGVELNGCEIVRRFMPILRDKLLRGSAVLFPMTNLPAIRNRQQHIDYKVGKSYWGKWDHDANQAWPGRADGTNAERVCLALYPVVSDADYAIDIHSWNEYTAATALPPSDRPKSLEMATATALRFARDRGETPPDQDGPKFPATIRKFYNDSGRDAIAVEFSGQARFFEREIARGVRAMKNVFRFLEFLPGDMEGQDEEMVWLNSAEKTEVTAPHSGLFVRSHLAPSDRVEEGDRLGCVFGDWDLRETAIRAPAGGYLYQFGAVRGASRGNVAKNPGHILHPFVGEGETIAIIAAPAK